jgi:hypothetical protein
VTEPDDAPAVKPVPVQLVAFVVDHVSDVELPMTIGFAPARKVTVGAIAAATVTFIVPVTVPPVPAQLSVYA